MILDQFVFSGTNLLLIYGALASKFLGPLVPCNTSRAVNNSMELRHMVALVGLVFFKMISEAGFDSIEHLLVLCVSSLFVYGWFMISAKMSANWWIPLTLILAILYFINTYRETSTHITKEIDSYLIYTEYVLLALSAILTLFGFIIYVGEKKIDYRGKFDYYTLLIGTETCKDTPSTTKHWDALKAAFLLPPGSSSSGQRGGFISEIAPVSSFDMPALE